MKNLLHNSRGGGWWGLTQQSFHNFIFILIYWTNSYSTVLSKVKIENGTEINYVKVSWNWTSTQNLKQRYHHKGKDTAWKVSKCFFCNWTRTQNHLVLKRTLNHLAKLASLYFPVFGLNIEKYQSTRKLEILSKT